MLPGVVTSLVAYCTSLMLRTKPRCQLLIVTLLVKGHECTKWCYRTTPSISKTLEVEKCTRVKTHAIAYKG